MRQTAHQKKNSSTQKMGRRRKPTGSGKRDSVKRERIVDEYFNDAGLKNEDFEEYYRTQQLMNEEEFKKFVDTLRKPLPISFRITGSRMYTI